LINLAYLIAESWANDFTGNRVSKTKHYRLPSLNALRAFDACCRGGGVRGGADLLSTTPSAVSHHLKNLEQDIGLQLFERLPGGLRLTPEGELLFRSTSASFLQLQESIQMLKSPLQNKPLVVGCLPSFTSLWLLPNLKNWSVQRFGFELQIETIGSAGYLELGRSLDLIIDVGRKPLRDGFEVEFVAPDLAGPVLQRSLHQQLASQDSNWFSKVTVLLPRSRTDILEKWCIDQFGVHHQPHKIIWFDHLHLCLAAARAGLGLSMVSYYYLSTEEMAPQSCEGLVAPFGFIRRQQPFVSVFPKHSPQLLKISVFKDWLSKMLLEQAS
jgi:LysR family transcriptional regulator, glycine cleavage system transcriptional activator